jgi:signal transduction histidine kinase
LYDKEILTIDDVLTFNRINDDYYYRGDPELISYCLRLLNVTDVDSLNQNIHSRIAREYIFFEMWDKALEHQMEAIEYSTATEDHEATAHSLIVLGNMYFSSQDYENAADLYRQTIVLAEEHHFPLVRSISLNNLGLIEEKKEHYEEAINFYRQSLDIRKKYVNDTLYIAHSYTHIGYAHALKNQKDSALINLKKARAIFQSISSEWGLNLVELKLAKAHLKWGDYEIARRFLEEGLSNPRISDNTSETIEYKSGLKDYYYQTGQKDDYVRIAKEIIALTDSMHLAHRKRDLHLELSEFHSQNGDSLQAFIQLAEYQKSLSEMDEAKEKAALADARWKIASMTRELQAVRLEQVKNRYSFIAAALTFALIFGGIFLFILYKKNDQLSQINAALEEKTQELDRKNAELRHSKEEIEETSRVKSEFLGRMSHEMRTPLNAITGLSELSLKEAGKSLVLRDNLNAITDSADHLLTIIDEILQFQKTGKGKLTLNKTNFKLSELLNQLVKEYQVTARNSNTLLLLELDKRIADNYYGDAGKITQVISNLLSNAFKFCQNGEVHIHCQLEKSEDSTESIAISVSDTGMGIPEDQLEKIFESFYQVSENIHRVYGGTGLGLSIVKSLVKLLEGSIAVQSKIGQGTRFTVTLPLQVAHEVQGIAET